MKEIILEDFIEASGVEVYPITLMKFLLNKKRVLSYLAKVTDPAFNISERSFKIDSSDCPVCEEKKKDGFLCRQHTSINRVIGAEKVLKDEDTGGIYFFKNEIFKQVGDSLVIVYCPHTKLIKGELTDERIRKIIPITVVDEKLSLPEFETHSFNSSILLNSFTKCWFNTNFSIMSMPKNSNYSSWALTKV